MVHVSIHRILFPLVFTASLASCGGSINVDFEPGDGESPKPSVTPSPQLTPTPAPSSKPIPTSSPNASATPTSIPTPGSTPTPSSTPTPISIPTPSSNPSATPTPNTSPTPNTPGGELSCERESDGDWLRAVGNVLVDRDCQPVWMTGANWFGFNATERVFHGLWTANMEDLIQAMTERGINILRVPISTQLMLEWRDAQFVRINVNEHANPDLKGLNSLEVFDKFLQLAENYGLKVMLDVHSAEADNSGHVAPVWYKGDISSDMFFQAWEWFAQRYKTNDTLIAYDLENEPHGKPWQTDFAKWDDSQDKHNWKYACEQAAKRILAINSRVLVLCEGIEVYPKNGADWSSMDEKAYHNNWWGGNLRGVADHPVALGEHQDQLIYSPHDYGPLVYAQPWFADHFDYQSLLNDVWRPNWFFIHEQDISPLFIGEWGGFMDKGDNEKWMGHIRDLISSHYLHHSFWVLNPNSGDTGGLVTNDWKTWDEDKYKNILLPTLWRDAAGLFVGLDHEVPLGGNAGTGITVTDFYKNGGLRPEGPEASAYNQQ